MAEQQQIADWGMRLYDILREMERDAWRNDPDTHQHDFVSLTKLAFEATRRAEEKSASLARCGHLELMP